MQAQEKPRFRVRTDGASPIAMNASAFRLASGGGGNSFEAAGHGRRLQGFQPSRNHVNAAIQKAGPTLLARARWLYENDGYAGNGIDEWVSAAAGTGIKPRPRIKNKALKRKLLDLFWRWTEEADAEGLTDYYGLQEKVAREAYLAGECFVRIRSRRPGDMETVPFQLQVMPAEMLDLSYDLPLDNGGFIRAGIEFNAIGQRVAYWFWREHPNDYGPKRARTMADRVRVPAADVIHVYDGRQGGQIRGVPRIARVLVKLFTLEVYDDAELERKKTTALFTGFLTGRGDNPTLNDDDDEDEDGSPIAPMTPGAIVDLGDDKDIKFSTPAESGNSYEPFQYRTLLKVAAGLGVPYAYMTGDVTKGNFSNVRTDILRFRRRVGQWQNNTMIFQFCRFVWRAFIDRAHLAGKADLPDYEKDPSVYWAADHLPPRWEWVDPLKDAQAEVLMIDNRLKSRTQSVAERGYDREDLDDEIAEEQASATTAGVPPPKKPAPPGGPGAGGAKEEDPDAEDEDTEEEDAPE